MKTWEIRITAENEAQAAKYLEMLKNGFEVSATYNLPMHGMCVENGEEKVQCNHIKE